MVFWSLIEEKNGFYLDSYFRQLKRIQREELVPTLDAPEIGVHEEVRESMDSLNSETLKDDSPSLVLLINVQYLDSMYILQDNGL